MATTTSERPTLSLVTKGGERVKRTSKAVRPLTDAQAYEQMIEATVSVQGRLDPSSEAWRELGYLLVELERSARAAA